MLSEFLIFSPFLVEVSYSMALIVFNVAGDCVFSCFSYVPAGGFCNGEPPLADKPKIYLSGY